VAILLGHIWFTFKINSYLYKKVFMKKNILNEELGRIKSLMSESKPNSNIEINEDILSLYKKFDITLNERTIEVLSNGMINEQGVGEKISTG